MKTSFRRWAILSCALLVALGLLALWWMGPQVARTDTPPDFEALAAQQGRVDAWYRLQGDRLPPALPQHREIATPASVRPLTYGDTLTHAVYLPLIRREGRVFPTYERRALWVTRFDWTRYNEPPHPAAIDALVANAAHAGFNTLFFQVRATGDAYYSSTLEPWAARLTGSLTETLGQDPGWDPLARMISTAHASGLEVHAYVNVYPTWAGETPPPKAITPTHPFWAWSHADYADWPPEAEDQWAAWRQWNSAGHPMNLNPGYLWASPGVDLVRDHIVAVVEDLVTSYPVDGIHLDLVRYANVDYSYDPLSNAAAGEVKTAARDRWQRDRVTDLVARIMTATRATRPDAWVTAAVWPYYEDRWGWGVRTGYEHLYQDSKGWLAEGVVDGVAPMLYGDGASIPDDLAKWETLAADFLAHAAGRHVYPGVGAYYTDFVEIEARIWSARALGAPGHVLFSYSALEAHDYWDELAAGPYAQPAEIPPRPTGTDIRLSSTD
ncbi:MAG: glycoside hydrolase family 10 protein [Anaerolineae bacterium]